jgi:hypothetical protein
MFLCLSQIFCQLNDAVNDHSERPLVLGFFNKWRYKTNRYVFYRLFFYAPISGSFVLLCGF